MLHDAAAAQGCEYVFGDSVAAVRETPKTVQATFRGGRSEAYDIAVGADGIHSAVRRLAFGPERDFVRFLGYHYALADLPEEALPAPRKAPAARNGSGTTNPACW
ncbi:FAD-dependent monooxygenase [Nocardiopsis composta]